MKKKEIFVLLFNQGGFDSIESIGEHSSTNSKSAQDAIEELAQNVGVEVPVEIEDLRKMRDEIDGYLRTRGG